MPTGEPHDFELDTVADDSSAAAAAEGYALVLIDGEPLGHRVHVDNRAPLPILIGQSPACQVQIADRTASRRHASIAIINGRLHVADLDSTNGTFVGGVNVTGAYLRPGDVLRVGATTFRVEQENASAAVPLSKAPSFGRLIGQSVEMRRLHPLLERLAKADVPVVLEGETGTGKEVLAEALHEQGPRASGPFVVFDCTSVPGNLMEAELFGHERGSFTGATTTRKGLFEQAQGGTLLIDEIGDLDISLQPKLLRVIERREVRRVGGNETMSVDVRVLAATRRDLDRAVQAGQFRDDLFHRLAVARVELPPLRLRWGDVSVLARHFWASMGGDPSALPADVVARWNEYSWPGNVRELRNAVVRQLTLGELGAEVRSTRPPTMPASAPDGVPSSRSFDFIESVLARRLPLAVARRTTVDELERRYLERLLAEHGGDTAKAASAAGIARRYFQILRARQQKG